MKSVTAWLNVARNNDEESFSRTENNHLNDVEISLSKDLTFMFGRVFFFFAVSKSIAVFTKFDNLSGRE